MTVESVLSARSLWFMDMRGLNPRGRNLYRLIGPLLSRWYGFTEPTEFDESKGVQFIGGEFSPSEKGTDMTGVNITLFADGIVAQTCTTTNDGDLFLGRGLERLAKDGIITYGPDMVRRKRYATEFVVKPMKPLRPLPNFSALYKLLAEIICPGDAMYADFEVSGLVFDIDPTLPRRQVPFTFQRRLGAEFQENLYYSHGPFSNEQHEQVLDELEKALGG